MRADARSASRDSVPAAEYVKRASPATSEDRLDALPQSAWTTSVFADAARELVKAGRFEVRVLRNRDGLPRLGEEVRYKYYLSYGELEARRADGEDLVVVAVVEGERVIGFGIASQGTRPYQIEILEVDEYSRRHVGVTAEVSIGKDIFGVGVGHVIVASLVDALGSPIEVDATSSESRYVFKSLGFVHRRGQTNPCLLDLPKREITPACS